MKIAFDNQIFNWQSYGGISRYYTNLGQELLNQGQNVGVFAGVHCNNYLSKLPDDAVSGIKLKRYPPKMNRLCRSFNNHLVNFQINNWQADIVHETYYSPKRSPNTTAVRITTVYDMIHELFPMQFPANDNTSSWKRNTFESVDHIISISHSTKKDLIELFGIDEGKISVVHLGVDLSFSQYLNKQKRELQRPFLLYVGGRGAYKNFKGLVQALANSQRLRNDFDLVVFGGDHFNDEEKSLISNLGFGENQIRHICGNDDVLTALYHQASAFVFPSLYEGFGLPPLEAMACSCPVISSDVSSIPEVAGNAAEYFDPTDIEAINVAIENVVYSPTRIAELCALGIDRARLFSWNKCASRTLEVYKKIAV